MSNQKKKPNTSEEVKGQAEKPHSDDSGQPDSGAQDTETGPQVEKPHSDDPGQPDSAAQDTETGPETAEALKDQLLRALAEIENVRKRASREREDAVRYGITGFARDIVGIVDNLRRAMDSVEDQPQEGGEVIKGLQAGITIIQQEFDAVLSRHGIEAISPLGEAFDHNFHQAMYEVEEGDQPPGTVVQVMQQGYKIHERLLRPAMVGVQKKPNSVVSEQKKEAEPEK